MPSKPRLVALPEAAEVLKIAANAGLSECCLHLPRHTDAIKEFNEAWWEEICRCSVRDQISFDYIVRFAFHDPARLRDTKFRRLGVLTGCRKSPAPERRCCAFPIVLAGAEFRSHYAQLMGR
jgi:hypothetical protein